VHDVWVVLDLPQALEPCRVLPIAGITNRLGPRLLKEVRVVGTGEDFRNRNPVRLLCQLAAGNDKRALLQAFHQVAAGAVLLIHYLVHGFIFIAEQDEGLFSVLEFRRF
jgi:hypothetical protein